MRSKGQVNMDLELWRNPAAAMILQEWKLTDVEKRDPVIKIMTNDDEHLQRIRQNIREKVANNQQQKMNVQIILADLNACSRTKNLIRGKQVHAEAVECAHDCNFYVSNALVNMYAKCGSMVDARKVFDGMKHRNVVSWTMLILGYANNGQGQDAWDLFIRMRDEGPAPDSVTMLAALKACTSLAVNEGASVWAQCRGRAKEIRHIARENGCSSDIYVQNCLIVLYAKCGSMIDARDVFDDIEHADVVSWTALILGYANNGEAHTALDMFTRMRTDGLSPDSVTLVAALKACIWLAGRGAKDCRDKGKIIHNLTMENGCNSDVYVQSTLIRMYAKFGSMLDARVVFDCMKHLDVVSWTVLILGYVDNGQELTALGMFTKVRSRGPAPDSVTLVAALKACTSLAVKEGASRWRDRGKVIHNVAVESGCNSDVYVQSTLVDMYAKCGSMGDAREVFDRMKHADVVLWTALILGYADNGEGYTALELFTKMRTEGIASDSVTLVAALKACTYLVVKEGTNNCKDKGREIHNIVVENGCNSDVHVQNTLIDMYSKHRNMVDAYEVFESIKNPDVVFWTEMILGYVDNGHGQTALDLFAKMRTNGPTPDLVTFGAVLKACGLVGALEFGRTIHSELDSVTDLDVVLVNCLVDFYAKCGSLVEAQRVFDLHAKTRDMITWNALLAGFSCCGDTEAAFGVFERLQDAGFNPDGITFLCVLTCCNHAGLVVKGKELFDTMLSKYGVIPSVEHYTCMIDLLGRANKLDDAVALLECMPCGPDNVTWRTILGASRKWKHVGIGNLAIRSLMGDGTKKSW